MSERKLANGWRKGSLAAKDIGTWTDRYLPVVYHEVTGEFWPRNLAPDSCFEPVEPAAPDPTPAERVRIRGEEIARRIEGMMKEGKTVFVRLVPSPVRSDGERSDGYPDRRAVGRVRCASPTLGLPIILADYPKRPIMGIYAHNLEILSPAEELALLNREASDG